MCSEKLRRDNPCKEHLVLLNGRPVEGRCDRETSDGFYRYSTPLVVTTLRVCDCIRMRKSLHNDDLT